MIEEQVKAVRDLMLQIICGHTSNHIAQYIAEHMMSPFVNINKGNDAYDVPVDIEHAAMVELPRYLDVGLQGGYAYLQNLPTQQKVADMQGYYETLDALDELAKIRDRLCKH